MTSSTLRDVAHVLSARFIKPYTDRLRRQSSVPLSAKQVHDPIWGTIALNSVEVALLDSPLLQRIRHLKQLGVAHWLYPGAGHSRFEHTLGVLHQAQQLMAALNRSASNAYGIEQIISSENQAVIRTSALLHDIGHPVLSHVSEYALRLDPYLLLEVQRERKANAENVSISELIAAHIARSADMLDLLIVIKQAHESTGKHVALPSNLRDFQEKVAHCILGQSVSSEVPLLHELVSGPYDADKLDYMVRDATTAGIPQIIDISRLVQKLTVKKFAQSDLPAGVAKHVDEGVSTSYLFGFTWSGISVVDELLLARLMLYSKLYRHPKVAAIESMVQLLIGWITDATGVRAAIDFIYGLADDQLILSSRLGIISFLGLQESDLTEIQDKTIKKAALLLNRLKDRELFVRAFAFFPHDPSGLASKDEKLIYADIVKFVSDQVQGQEFLQDIKNEVGSIIRHVANTELATGVDAHDIEMIVLRKIEAPSQKELRHAWVFPSSGPPRNFSDTGIYKDAWSGSFNSASAKAYLFSPRSVASFAYVAAETVIRRRFKLRVSPGIIEEVKQSPERVEQIKLALRDSGYYACQPIDLWPLHPRMRKVDIRNVISRFAEKVSVVQDRVVEEGDSEGKMSPAMRATRWLNQFSTEREIESGARLLEQCRVIGRDEAVKALREFLKKYPDFQRASLVSLSQGGDSTSIVQYYAGDVSGGLKAFGSLAQVVNENRQEPVLFVDDFCGSGGQWVNIVASLFGASMHKRDDLNEQRVLALEPEREYLRGRQIAFLFVAAWEEGLDQLRTAVEDVGLNTTIDAYLKDDDLPYAFSSEVEDDEFKERAREIGRKLLTSSEPDWPQVKIDERALGYGNRGLLLFFPYNAPSQTLTMLWGDGEVDGLRWSPIIRRRKKVIPA